MWDKALAFWLELVLSNEVLEMQWDDAESTSFRNEAARATYATKIVTRAISGHTDQKNGIAVYLCLIKAAVGVYTTCMRT